MIGEILYNKSGCFCIIAMEMFSLLNQKNRIFIFLWTAALLFVFLRMALYDGLVVRKYAVYTPLVSEPHTFVLLTDLHSTYYGEDQMQILSTIEKYSPEAVFMAGDIADDKREFDGTAALLSELCCQYPCYYVTGNHERWVEYTDDIKTLFRSYGVETLDAVSSPVRLGGDICLFGIDDPLFYENTSSYLEQLEKLAVSEETFDLLLAHRPEFYEKYVDVGLDLTLCGHAHGGQVRIPLLMNGLYAPNQGFFPEYAGGRYDAVNHSSMIVSRGLMLDDLPRIFNPPEICIIRILPEDRNR